MNILLISPSDVACTSESKYIGIERLVLEYSKELIKTHQVTVISHKDSIFSPGVVHLPTVGELNGFREYQGKFHQYDSIIDFSHLHLASRFTPKLKSLNIFWHAPALHKYPKSPYNIIAPSQWAAREFQRVYGQKARPQNVIMIDPEVYKPADVVRSKRFITIGRMSPEKGNLAAIKLCRELNIPLDVAGGRGMEIKQDAPLTPYEEAVQKLCDGELIKFLGEVTDEEKIKLFQNCAGLIYATDHPEVTTHKVYEAMLCGAPVVVPNIGSAQEWVTEGVNGFLCNTKLDFITAIMGISKLDTNKTLPELQNRFRPSTVISQWEELFKEVSSGSNW